jgi:DNA-directed RNA polymerase specialized sigma24 family protein
VKRPRGGSQSLDSKKSRSSPLSFPGRAPVNATSVSLLDRLRSARPDDHEWLRLEEIYQPLIRRWLCRAPGLGDEAADLTQEVFLVMVREIPNFRHQHEGSFPAWVRKITVNVLRNHRRRRRAIPAGGLDGSDDLERTLPMNSPTPQIPATRN